MTQETTQASDLAKVIPEVKTVRVGTEDVPVPRIKVKQLSAVVKLIAPFIPVLRKEGKLDIPTMLMTHNDEVIAMLMAISEKPREWFDEMEIDELIDFASATVEANIDFFIQRVLPSALRAMGVLQSVMLDGSKIMSGLMQSKASSQQDTATPK